MIMNELPKKILEKPFEFYKIAGKLKSPSRMMFEGEKEIFEINDNKEELVKNLRESSFNEFLKGLSDMEITNFANKVAEEINRLRKWIQNSKIRENSFYYLGKSESTTATEIGKIISKHPKSVSTYLSEFKIERWVDEPIKDGREMKYSLSNIGHSYFTLALENNWFHNLYTKKISLNQTLINIGAYELLSEKELHPKVKIYYEKEKKEPDYTDIYEDIYFFESYRDYYELNNKFIKEMIPVIETIAEKFEGTRDLPKITPLENDLIVINTTDDLKLAVFFAAFNYSKKNRFKNKFYWDYGTIKIVKMDDYFDDNIPDINNSEGFMSEEQSKKFVKKILANYRTKIKNEKS